MKFGMYNNCDILQHITLDGIIFVNTDLHFGAKSSKNEFVQYFIS